MCKCKVDFTKITFFAFFRKKYVHKNKKCKVDFTKITFFAFFSQKICIYQKKAVPLHQIYN